MLISSISGAGRAKCLCKTWCWLCRRLVDWND